MRTDCEIMKHQLPYTIASIAMVEELIDQYKKDDKIPEVLYGNCLIATTEAVTNAINHGNKLDESKKILLQFKFRKKEIVVEIMDEGSGFDYANLADPTAENNLEKTEGRGVFIMESLCDKVDFEEGGKKIVLHFSY